MGSFDEYGFFSNRKLNLAKTVLVPFFNPGRLEEAKEVLRRAAPHHGEYGYPRTCEVPGHPLGAGRGGKGWDAPSSSTRHASSSGLGSTLVSSTTPGPTGSSSSPSSSYHLQFYGDKDEALQAESRAIKHIFP
eukprot:10982200-Alexandrium_andersonii.AAC.1